MSGTRGFSDSGVVFGGCGAAISEDRPQSYMFRQCHDIQLELHQYLPNRPTNSRNRQEIIELVYTAFIFCNNERNLWFSAIAE